MKDDAIGRCCPSHKPRTFYIQSSFVAYSFWYACPEHMINALSRKKKSMHGCSFWVLEAMLVHKVHHVDVQPSPKDTMPLGTRVLFGPGCVILWLLRSRCKTGRGARTRFQLPLQVFRALQMQQETKQTFRSHQWLGT